jgi:hypothetical protein
MVRAILDGWLVSKPEKRAEVIGRLIEIATGYDSSPADSIAAAKCLIQTELAIAKLDQDDKHADQAKVIVVRRVDSGLALAPPEPDPGTEGKEPV